MSTDVNAMDRNNETLKPTLGNTIARAALEVDFGRQARRVRRLLAGRTVADELRDTVRGKRVLVTGASSGIGRAVARRLIAAGAEVLLVARRKELLQELVEYARTQVAIAYAYPCDLSQESAVRELVSTVLARHGGVDILINNAGRSIRRSLSDTTDRLHDYERVMQLNFFGVVWLTAPLVARMRETGGGHVVNVSTMGTQFRGTPHFAAYMASKGALDQFAGSVAPETLRDGVVWTTVHLPLVQTEMIAPAARAWKTTPTLSLDTGASMVISAIVRRPAKVATPLGTLVGALDRVLPSHLVRLKSRGFHPTPKASLPRVVIVGAGISGMAMALRLKEAGHEDFVILEKAASIGGTWRDNAYPGLNCDVPAHFYSFRRALKPDWTRALAPGTEIREYLESVVDSFDLRRHIRFNTEVTAGRFRDGQWQVQTSGGDTLVAPVLVCATGCLHHPKYPDIPGLGTFKGKVFHSARWDATAAVDGARVGVMGTGSTGVQLAIALSRIAKHLTVFQRTPQWVVPVPNGPVPAVVKTALRHVPGLDLALYRGLQIAFNDLALSATEDRWQRALAGFAARRNLASVRDPTLRAKLTPNDEVMCKRVVMAQGYYAAVQRDNVAVIDTPIREICADGVITVDGLLHRLDTLVLATGFDAQAFMRPMTLSGPDGATVEGAWRNGPRAYLTTMIPGLPNLFLLMGPNSPVGNTSLLSVAEVQASHVYHWLARMRDRALAEVEPRQDAMDAYYRDLREGMTGTAWVTGCDSWYLGPDGVPMTWPWHFDRFRDRLTHPDYGDYAVRHALPEKQRRKNPGRSST